MILDQQLIDQINSRVRLRLISLPVKYGKFGELKKCPLKPGDVRQIKPRVPYQRYCERAEQQPTKAAAVLWLIDRCQVLGRPVTITVMSVERQDDQWLIQFKKGEHRELFDVSVYLSRDNDFTMSPSRQTVKGDPPYVAPLAEDLRRARAKALESRVSRQRTSLREAANHVETLRESMSNMKAEILVRQAQRKLEAAERLLSADDALQSGAHASRSESRSVHAATETQGEVESLHSSVAVVSLEPAA